MIERDIIEIILERDILEKLRTKVGNKRAISDAVSIVVNKIVYSNNVVLKHDL